MPVAVIVIGFAIFAQGTSELMIAGLLPELAADLSVSIPQAGLLVTGFALGMLVGAPVLAVLTLRWPRRAAMLSFIAAFIVMHIVSALTSSYTVLFAARFLAAFVYAGFWAVGGSTAMAMVPPHRRGRAMSIVAGGLTVATVIGLPAGTWIGQNLGWRAAFWLVTALSALAAIAIVVKIPHLTRQTVPRLKNELTGLVNSRLWLSYAMTATATAALLGTFTYLAAMLIEHTHIGSGWVPVVLLLYGVGALTGMAVGGKAADARPRALLLAGFTGLAIVSALLAGAAAHSVPTIVLVFLIGLVGFSTNPALNSRVFAIAPTAPTLAVAGNISAFNVGISIGPWLGGLALTTDLGYPTIPLTGTILAAIALVLAGIDSRLNRRTEKLSPPGWTGRRDARSAIETR